MSAADRDFDLSLVYEEHQGLKRSLEDLLQCVSQETREQSTVQDKLQDLADRLIEHFEQEEHKGYFAEAMRRAPRLTTQAHDLMQEHEELTEAVLTLNTMARSGVESPEWWSRIESDSRRFAERLHRHEAAETKLLQTAYTVDLGAGD